MSIEDKLAKAAELEALAAKLRAEVEAEKVKKWEPKASHYFIDCDGDVVGNEATEVARSVVNFGASRLNREQAEKDATRMRTFNRLLCWLVEQGWDGELEIYIETTGEVVMNFNGSGDLGLDLMYGIGNGVIEL